MTAPALRDALDMHTSASGPMYHAMLAAVIVGPLLSTPTTASSYPTRYPMERTAAGPAGEIDHITAESTAEAILEIRRLSGLTWEELGDLFDVSRRSIHHWANGKPVSAKNEQIIRRMLSAVRFLDRGNQADTRAQLLAVDQDTDASALDLLKDGHFEAAMGRVEGARAPAPRRIPLSPEAQNARKLPSPALLLEAEQDHSQDVPVRARAVRSKRASKKAG